MSPSKALVVIFSVVLLVSSEVAAEGLPAQAKSVGFEDAKYGDGGGGGGYPGGGGGRGGGGGYPGGGGGRGGCRYGCCRCCNYAGEAPGVVSEAQPCSVGFEDAKYGGGGGRGGYPGGGGNRGGCRYGCCRCCDYAGEAPDSVSETQPHN